MTNSIAQRVREIVNVTHTLSHVCGKICTAEERAIIADSAQLIADIEKMEAKQPPPAAGESWEELCEAYTTKFINDLELPYGDKDSGENKRIRQALHTFIRTHDIFERFVKIGVQVGEENKSPEVEMTEEELDRLIWDRASYITPSDYLAAHILKTCRVVRR